METQTDKTNWFVRILIIVFCIGLFVMVFYNFLLVDPKGEINNGLLTLLFISLILVLAESFDNFSIGKLISISRDAKKKEKHIQGLEKKNSELINQIISIQNIQSQTQQHTNVYGDFNISQKPEQVAGKEGEPEVDKKAVEKLLAVIGDSVVISELETRIVDDMKAKNLNADGDSVKVLVKHLAGTQILLAFERIHNMIFGSQIYLLKKLNESVGVGKPMDIVKRHIDHVRNIFSDSLSSWTDEQYLQFLYDRLLIVRNDEQLHITNLGVEYLMWLVRNGRSENRPL